MQTLQNVEQLLPQLTREEKTQVLHKLVEELGAITPGIDRSPGVLGGDARIVRTRIPVWLLVHARNLGATDADLLRSYPTLRPDDLINAWLYAQAHAAEIDQQILENEAA